MKILTVENLSKSFGGIHANRDISFDVEEGSILGVIGPNGAGKSTLFDLITGFTKPDAGKASGLVKPVIKSNKVDLPAPLGPITPNIEPSSTSKEISLFACIPPNDLLKFSTVNIFIVVSFFLKYLLG